MEPQEFGEVIQREAEAGGVDLATLAPGVEFKPEHHQQPHNLGSFTDPEDKHRIRKVEHEISRLMSLGLDYTFGGGRNCGSRPCPNGPGDCSWFASRLCDVLGVNLKNWLGSTYSLAEEGKAGKGRYFTLMIKNPPDPHEAHVVVEISHGPGTKVRHAECGGSDNPTFGNGPSWVHMDSGRLAEFPIHRHFHGL
jgi:hypothetical protein